jgi:ABC-type transport system involved in multi-copper enzyme maturation permease subunit
LLGSVPIFNSLGDWSAWADHWQWIAFAVIVGGGMLFFGLADLGRFSFTRAWAISGVCFDDSIRRRVLWVTPLAMLGVIAITQFQKAIDEQDSLRETLKFCLFATGTVVILISIILASTNIPKEIESRVIFTVVTKPATRLELIVGKVMGFARVSLAVLAIMGLFTWGYLRLREYQKRGELTTRLQQGDTSTTEHARMAHYLQTGMLAGRTLYSPGELQIYGRVPDPNSPIRVISDNGTEEFAAGFAADRTQLFGPIPESGDEQDWSRQGIGALGLIVRVELNTKRTGPPSDQPDTDSSSVMGPNLPTSRKAAHQILPPSIQLELLGGDLFSLAQGGEMLAAPDEITLRQGIAEYVKLGHLTPGVNAGDTRLSFPIRRPDGTTIQFLYAWLPPPVAQRLFNTDTFFLRVAGNSDKVDYLIGPDPVHVFVPQYQNGQIAIDPPGADEVPRTTSPDGRTLPLIFRGRLGIHGDQEIQGTDKGPAGVAVFGFRNAPTATPSDGQIPFELNLEVERLGNDVQEGNEDASTVNIVVHDLASGQTNSQDLQIESHLTTFFSVPAGLITGPDFNVMIFCQSPGQVVGIYPGQSLQLVVSHQMFELNLLKSLTIIWMMSILVLSLAVLCSTFLSWPIAIVLTIVLLLARWVFNQMADTTGPGLGRQIVNDFKFNDAPVAKVVSTSVDTLSRAMTIFSQALPDTSSFDAISDIEQGVTISFKELEEALWVMGGFGVPAVVMAYLILKKKEVAP